jgi:hypothetical protein
MKKIATIALLVLATSLTCLAVPTKAPEIDMNSIGTVSALVGCIVLMARGRRKRQ